MKFDGKIYFSPSLLIIFLNVYTFKAIFSYPLENIKIISSMLVPQNINMTEFSITTSLRKVQHFKRRILFPRLPQLRGSFFFLPRLTPASDYQCNDRNILSEILMNELAQLCLTLCNAMDCQAPLSMEFSRPEYWRGQPFPSPGHLPNPVMEPRFLTLKALSLPSEPQVKPKKTMVPIKQNISILNNLLSFSPCLTHAS